jgi:hypothetical protein
VCGDSLPVQQFALFALEDRHTSCMTCGLGPPCSRRGCLGARCASDGIPCSVSRCERESFPRKGIHSACSSYPFAFSPNRLRPFAFVLLRSTLAPPAVPFFLHAPQFHVHTTVHAMASLGHPDRFQCEAVLNLVRVLLGWSALGLAGRNRAGAAPLSDLVVGEFVLFVSYISCGLALPISPFFLVLLEEFRLQLQHLTPHSILLAAIFVHLCEMFVGVAPCTSLFRHFFVLVKSGKARDHLGAYYFQTRPDSVVAYISTFSGARWENWRGEWVIASAEANDRLVLPNNGPALDRKHWRTKPSLSPELLPVLDRIKTLATGGLTSMHVVGDFLKRRVMPLQRRPRLCYWFTGPNDIGRIQRGPGTDLSREELELLVKGITGESFVPKSLILPQDTLMLCDDSGLRTAVLATLPTLDDSGVAVRQTGGRDPLREIQIPGVPTRGPQPAGTAPCDGPTAAPSPLDKGKGAASSASTPGGTGGSEEEMRRRLHCVDESLVSDPQKRPRTAGEAEEVGFQAQGA